LGVSFLPYLGRHALAFILVHLWLRSQYIACMGDRWDDMLDNTTQESRAPLVDLHPWCKTLLDGGEDAYR
jgi:hypothetical protein